MSEQSVHNWKKRFFGWMWAFPDVWEAMAESHQLARMVLSHWPRLDQLARARTVSVAALCDSYLRDGGDPQTRAERIRQAARGWARFWTGRVDLEALAWDVTELLADLDIADRKIEEANRQVAKLWRSAWGADELLRSVSGVGEVTAR